MRRCIVQLSGGVASWVTARRAIEAYGRDNVTLLFADTLIEDDDLYRFLADVEADTGITITRVADGRNPWEVFRDRKFIGNSRVNPCSLVLKRALLRGWLDDNCNPETDDIAIGIDWTETHRVERITAGLAPFNVVYPLIETNTDKVMCFDELAIAGIEVPNLYKLGFSHNNCGGFCIKAGISQFVRLYRTMPERYAWHENQEQVTRVAIGKDVAVMRDRRGGETKRMTMADLRVRIEAGESFPDDELGGCGCALDDSNPSQLTLDIWGIAA